jgi:hypothetical protein
MGQLWKPNWPQTRANFERWWKREGMLLGCWGTGLPTRSPHAAMAPPADPGTPEARQTNADYIARNVRYEMSRKSWPGDILPSAWPHIGTLPLAAYLGAKPRYAPANVWYEACMKDLADGPPLKFDPGHPECRQLEAIVRETLRLADGNYFVGMPALLGGIDILAELRGAADLMIDLMENGAAVQARLRQIQDAYVPAFNRMYDLLKFADGSMCFGYFMLWGRGKTGLCQCDTSVMFSTDMFREFVVPYLREQCAFLDNSMFHIDGSPCLAHLDPLLEIDDLDAIEFTPEPKVPGGGDPHWFDFYRRVLKAGKSLWVANLQKEEVVPVLDAIGGKGVYINVVDLSESDFEKLVTAVEPYR